MHDVHRRQWGHHSHVRNILFVLNTQDNPNVYVVSTCKAEVQMKKLGNYLWGHLNEHYPSVLSLGRLCNELGSLQ